jgi:hypothetical protein
VTWYFGALAILFAAAIIKGLVSGTHDVTFGTPILRDVYPTAFWGCTGVLALLCFGMAWLALIAFTR